jgi:sterol desaturase/sphingolipid hydroxylase (fatty acid hydroxylase superfamily)
MTSIGLYDFIFYWVHLGLHKVPWLLRNIHATHHRQEQLTAREVVHHSLADGTLQVLANISALKLLGVHPLARAAHNCAVTYLLTESHAGYDMPWMLHNVVPCGILGGPPRHEAHHKYGTVHYHQVRFPCAYSVSQFLARYHLVSHPWLTDPVGLPVFYLHGQLARL